MVGSEKSSCLLSREILSFLQVAVLATNEIKTISNIDLKFKALNSISVQIVIQNFSHGWSLRDTVCICCLIEYHLQLVATYNAIIA